MCAQIFWPFDLLPHFVLRENSFHTGNWNCLSIHFHTIFAKPNSTSIFDLVHALHMWLVGHPNPCELLQSWECIFLKHYSHMNTKWALKKKSIDGLLCNCDFKIFV